MMLEEYRAEVDAFTSDVVFRIEESLAVNESIEDALGELGKAELDAVSADNLRRAERLTRVLNGLLREANDKLTALGVVTDNAK